MRRKILLPLLLLPLIAVGIWASGVLAGFQGEPGASLVKPPISAEENPKLQAPSASPTSGAATMAAQQLLTRDEAIEKAKAYGV